MSKINDKARAIQDVCDNLMQMTRQNIEEHEEYFCDSVRDTLYNYGIDGKGQSLGEYSEYTIAHKRATGQPYDRVTLREAGDFYDDMHLEMDSEGFEVDNDNWKANILMDRYGGDITTISEHTIDEYVQNELKPYLQDEIKYKLS